MKDVMGRENRRLEDRACASCGAKFRPARDSAKYCSRRCAWSKNGGHNRKPDGIWWVTSKGYIEGRIWLEGTPRTVKQHRWLMEQELGRSLEPDEHIHHVNGDKADNRIENLVVVAADDHARHHNAHRIYKRGYKKRASLR